jgi:hypothetical protein
MGLGRQDRRIETLEVPDLQNAFAPGGELDQSPRLGRCLRDRLLHQHMRAGGEKVPCDRKVSRCRRDDAYRIDRTKQFTIVRHRSSPNFDGDLVTGLLSGVGDGNELALRCLGIFLCMKSAEVADTDDCCSDFLHEGAIMPARVGQDSD